MPWDAEVPNQANIVRGATGDLVKMRQNFATLDPIVVSGLHALVSGGAVASGSVVVVSGSAADSPFAYRLLVLGNLDDVDTTGAASGEVLTFDGTEWAPGLGATALGDLTDVNTAGASSGQVLKFNGTTWVPDTDEAGSSGGAPEAIVHLAMVSGGTEDIANNSEQQVSGLTNVRRNEGGFTVSGGRITVPTGSGYTHVQLYGQVRFASAATPAGYRQVSITLSGGGALEDELGDKYAVPFIRQQAVTDANSISVGQVFMPMVPVSGGETFELRVRHTQGANLNIEGGTGAEGLNTMFQARALTLGSGGGGGGGSGGDVEVLGGYAIIRLSGAQDTFTGDNTVISGDGGVTGEMVEAANVGGWAIDLTHGAIEVASGFEYIQVQAQAQFEGTAGGRRLLSLVSGGPVSGTHATFGPTITRASMPTAGAGSPVVFSVTSPIIRVGNGDGEVPAGTPIAIQTFHNAAGNTEIQGGTGNKITWLMVRVV